MKNSAAAGALAGLGALVVGALSLGWLSARLQQLPWERLVPEPEKPPHVRPFVNPIEPYVPPIAAAKRDGAGTVPMYREVKPRPKYAPRKPAPAAPAPKAAPRAKAAAAPPPPRRFQAPPRLQRLQSLQSTFGAGPQGGGGGAAAAAPAAAPAGAEPAFEPAAPPAFDQAPAESAAPAARSRRPMRAMPQSHAAHPAAAPEGEEE